MITHISDLNPQLEILKKGLRNFLKDDKVKSLSVSCQAKLHDGIDSILAAAQQSLTDLNAIRGTVANYILSRAISLEAGLKTASWKTLRQYSIPEKFVDSKCSSLKAQVQKFSNKAARIYKVIETDLDGECSESDINFSAHVITLYVGQFRTVLSLELSKYKANFRFLAKTVNITSTYCLSLALRRLFYGRPLSVVLYFRSFRYIFYFVKFWSSDYVCKIVSISTVAYFTFGVLLMVFPTFLFEGIHCWSPRTRKLRMIHLRHFSASSCELSQMNLRSELGW